MYCNSALIYLWCCILVLYCSGRRPKKLGIVQQKSEPVVRRAAVKEEEEDETEEPCSTDTSPALARQALSAPSTIPAMIKTPPGTLPPPKETLTASHVDPEKSDEETPVDEPSWAQSGADASKISPPTNDEEDEKMEQDGVSSHSNGSAGADAKREATPLSSQWPKEDSSSDTEQADSPLKGFLRLENDAGEESQLTSDGEEGSSSDTDEDDTVDPPLATEPMEVGNSPSADEREDRQNDLIARSKQPDEESRPELPKWIPVPPAVSPEMESERKEDFSATTANGAVPNSHFVFPDVVVPQREKSTSSSCEDVSKTEELPSSDQEQGQSSTSTINSATGEDPSAADPCGKKGKGRLVGRGSPEIRRKLKRASSSDVEPPRKRIADLPDDDTNPWRVDFSGESSWFASPCFLTPADDLFTHSSVL